MYLEKVIDSGEGWVVFNIWLGVLYFVVNKSLYL